MHASKAKIKARSAKSKRQSGAADIVSISSGSSRSLSHSHGGFYASGPVVSLSQVQAKFTIGKANDPYEREADAVADHVLSGKQAPPITPVPAAGLGSVAQMEQGTEVPEEKPPQTRLIQRQAEEEPEEEAVAQPQLIQRETEESETEAEPPQTKLIQTQLIQRQSKEEPEEHASPQPQLIQREVEDSENEAELPQTQLVQREAVEEPEKEPEEQAPPQPQLIQREVEDGENEAEPPQTQLVQREAVEEPEEQAPPQPQLIQREMADSETEAEPPQTRLIQRQAEEEPEEQAPPQPQLIQREVKDSENEAELPQTQLVQRETVEEPEKEPEEEAVAQPQLIQRETEESETEAELPQTRLIQRQAEEESEEETVAQPQLIQRECENCGASAEKPVQTKAQTDKPSDDVDLQGHSSGSPKNTSSRVLSGALAQAGMGEPLNSPVRHAMESSTGLDFSSVRIHSDGAAHQANHAIRARAFTHGSDIWLGRGESQNDRRLMAHELTHVVQQNSINHGVRKIQHKPSSLPDNEDAGNVSDESQEEMGGNIDETNIPLTPLENNRQLVEGKQGESQKDTESKDTGSDIDLPTEKPAEAKGRGDSGAQDDPAAIRLPIDQDPNAEEVPEEPSTEGLKVQLKTLASAPQVEPPTSQRLGLQALGMQRSSFQRPGAVSISTRVAEVTRSAGLPLPNSLQRLMGAHLNADLGGIQLHYDARSAKLARFFNARAFAHGEHIVFGSGQYQPDTPQGKHLIAHEITHVLQQRHLSQNMLQNSAVKLLQRQEEECPPADPVPEVEVVHSPASPQQDPAFNKAKNRVKNRANNQAQHGKGEDKSTSANAAAEVKEGEKKSHGQKDQVGKMDDEAQNPPAFNKKAFINKVLSEAEKTAPKTLDDFLKFAKRGKADDVKSAVTGEVKKSQKDSQDPLNKASKVAPTSGQSPRTATTLEVEPAGQRPGSARASRAMPPPKTESEIDFQADTTKTENILKDACVTRDYMDKHNDPELKAGAEAQDQLKQSTTESPQTYREEEAATLAGARGKAASQGQKGIGDMFGQRGESFAQVGGNQKQTKTDNEVKRDAAAKEIDGIFTTTQTNVQNRLKLLDTDVETTFDCDAGKASEKFQDFVDAKAKSLKKGMLDSLIDWVAEDLFGAPPKDAEKAYVSGRLTFVKELTAVIGKIADLVSTGLSDARKLVEKGKLDVKTKLDSLGTDLDGFKQQKADEMNDRFRGLEGEIAKKQSEVIQGLAKRYVNTLKEAKAAEKSIRDKYKNAVERARDVYNKIKDAIIGWIKKLAAVVGGAASKIIRQPGKFLSNLGAGITQGFTLFMDNIGDNIKEAVVEWLTGNMDGGGISLPKTFDARGLIGFLIELVGLGVASIKKIARKVFGATAVSLIEKGVAGAEKIKQIFDILSTEGPAGLFKYLAAEFDTMKEKVMGEAGTALAEGLVVAGIKKVLGIVAGLVSGGIGSVITIVLTIIDVVLWIRDNASRIAELVSTIAGMAMAILNGQVAAIASAINKVLKRLLPLVLGFVGALVGIGGVVRKIQGIFKAIRKPATKMITKLFMGFKNLVKKLITKVKKKFGKGKDKAKGKEKKLSPSKVRGLIISALKKPAKAEDPLQAIAETKALAASLKSKYQPKLKKGAIKITILDQTAEGVEKDDDIDMDVALSPGTKVARKVNTTLVKKFKRQISRSHSVAKADIKKLVESIKKSQSNIKKWDSVKNIINVKSPLKGYTGSPVNKGHAFGTVASTIFNLGVNKVKVVSQNMIKKARAGINAGSGFYAKPKALFIALIYNNSASQQKISNAVTKATEASFKDKPAEPYNRKKHYGKTPTSSDRTWFMNNETAAVNKAIKDQQKKKANSNWVLDHEPPLVTRYYKGASGEKAGFKMTAGERKASGSNRSNMSPQPRFESDAQGGEMSAKSRAYKKEYFGK